MSTSTVSAMNLLWLCSCWIVVALFVGDCGGTYTTASVYFNGSSLEVRAGVIDKDKAVAYGMYNDTVNENGWRELHIAAGYSDSGKFTDEEVMMAAGMLEGYLSQLDIYSMYTNMYGATFTGKQMSNLQKVKDFYSEQREWAEQMVSSEASKSDYWYYTGLILAQFKGLQLGYAMAAPPTQQLETFAFDFLSGNGDYLDIRQIVSPEDRPDVTKTSKEELLSLMHKGHCSGLIKILPGYENIYAAHSSWYIYSAMNRIYKHYAFSVSATSRSMVPTTKVMSFSSYPAYLSSLDDFYIMDSGLVMIQTTIGVFNRSLYDLSTTKALLAWQRARLANWLAGSGEEWANIFSQHNSGTYNNQYMVLDLKRVELKKAVRDGTLWVVEQIPGYVESGDQTHILQAGYWPSYNVPFYEEIFRACGYSTAAEAYGTEFSYQLCPRAKIFRRDQGTVKDMDTMKHIMRYNDYKNDVYSMGSPVNAICSRGDLLNPPESGGCYDTKVTDYYMAAQQMAYAVSGPTHQDLPPFNWTASGLTEPHSGQPNFFNFTFVKMQPGVP